MGSVDVVAEREARLHTPMRARRECPRAGEVLGRNRRLRDIDARQRERHVGWRNDDLEAARRKLRRRGSASVDLRAAVAARSWTDRRPRRARRRDPASGADSACRDGERNEHRVRSNAGKSGRAPRRGRGADSIEVSTNRLGMHGLSHPE